MNKNQSKPLKINRTTLRKIDADGVAGVRGGAVPTTLTSLVSAVYDCPQSGGVSFLPCC